MSTDACSLYVRAIYSYISDIERKDTHFFFNI